jgi:hypothetical protein
MPIASSTKPQSAASFGDISAVSGIRVKGTVLACPGLLR